MVKGKLRFRKWLNDRRYGECVCIHTESHPGLSYWVKRGGYRMCNLCGSVHSDDLINFMRGIFERTQDKGAVSKIFDRTTKGYKFYVDLPGKGAPIKLYMWHMTDEHRKAAAALLPTCAIIGD